MHLRLLRDENFGTVGKTQLLNFKLDKYTLHLYLKLVLYKNLMQR